MNQTDWIVLWKRLSVLYPRDFPADNVEMMGVWGGFFRHHDAGMVMAAVNSWTDSHRRAPAIADLKEGIAAHKRSTESVTTRSGTSCGQCDHGWTYTLDGDVMRCANGCVPPLPDSTYREPEGERSVTPGRVQSLRETLAQLDPGWTPGRRGRPLTRHA